MRYLNCEKYDEILLAALRQQGLSDHDARQLIACRWPMDATGIISEASGRGLLIDAADVSAFAAELRDGLDADDVLFIPASAEMFFNWCVTTERARLTPMGRYLQRDDADKVIRQTCRRACAANN